MSTKINADDSVVNPKDSLGNPPMAWIVQPKFSAKLDVQTAPYLTMKPGVAMKRYQAGDHVTPYHNLHEIPESEDDL